MLVVVGVVVVVVGLEAQKEMEEFSNSMATAFVIYFNKQNLTPILEWGLV